MSEYTPTTDEVVMGKTDLGDNFWRELTEDEIRRWLVEHDRQVSEKAFDEGVDEVSDNVCCWHPQATGAYNPYRKGWSDEH